MTLIYYTYAVSKLLTHVHRVGVHGLEMERIKDTIELVIRDLLVKKSGFPNECPEVWLRKVLTKKELGHIKLQYFRKGILGLITDSSSWLYSLNLKKNDLLNKLKQYSQEIKEVRFSIGDLK